MSKTAEQTYTAATSLIFNEAFKVEMYTVIEDIK